MRRWSIAALAAAGIVVSGAAPAIAEQSELRLAKQFSMVYLQFNILEHRKLIEARAKEAGLGEVKVTWVTFNGPDAMNTALLSNDVDVVAGGVPGLVTLWAKTKGTPQEVRGVSALSSQPFLLNTRNPAIKTIRDLTDADHIAVPAVKVSVQAVTLEMAAAQAFGKDGYDKLDHLTMSLSPPDATIGLISGGGAFDSAFSVPPFQEQQLQNSAVHTVLNSFDVLGGSTTFTVAWTSKKFHDANPKLYRALLDALGEANTILNADKTAGAALWKEDSNSKLALDFIAGIVSGPQVTWTLTPEHTMRYALFMHEVGTIKEAPSDWRDLFFPEVHNLGGS
ncbi:MAG TPA: ABC transporter substrate-binding protein [Stellaceae bacterium]|nr:ABC transporter substrate-binding protein [Stellaceae bacterium]